MDAATAAAMSDPSRNWFFRRRWTDPPDLGRERRETVVRPPAELENGSSAATDRPPAPRPQRTIHRAARSAEVAP